MITPAAQRGSRLEQNVSAFFAGHGYAVRTNEIQIGRSGARHEIDVYAEKSDALTTFRVVIECKAWTSPIEKDVVTKLHYVMGDLGLHKAIIVSLAGARSGAEVAARELGIELWGPNELRHHLGETAFADVAQTAPAQVIGTGVTGWGWPFRAAPDLAGQLISREGKGRFGLRTYEQPVWFGSVWVPAHVVQLTIAQHRAGRFRTTLTSNAIHNLYDALSGKLISPPASAPGQVQLRGAVLLKPIRRETQAHAAIRKAHEARVKVSTPAAVARHDQALLQLGVPTPCDNVTVDKVTTVYLPAFIGLLSTPGGERLVAVDGHTGAVSEVLTRLLTAHMAHVRSSFAR